MCFMRYLKIECSYYTKLKISVQWLTVVTTQSWNMHRGRYQFHIFHVSQAHCCNTVVTTWADASDPWINFTLFMFYKLSSSQPWKWDVHVGILKLTNKNHKWDKYQWHRYWIIVTFSIACDALKTMGLMAWIWNIELSKN